MTRPPANLGRGAPHAPVAGFTVLYDADCPLCVHLGKWVGRQRQLVPLRMVPAASEEARRRFPGLDHPATLSEITVIGDGGQIYRDTAAWVAVLWALSEHRETAHRLSSPAGARFARAAVLAASKWRESHRTVGPMHAGVQQGAGWGDGMYRRPDGWTYRPDSGWAFTGNGCAGDGCGTR